MGPELDLLVTAARAGGSWAFAALWEELAPVVLGYVRARGAPEPEDVTSEVFLAAFARIGSFAGDGRAFRSWLFTIAHHKAVDAVRRPARDVPAGVLDDGRTTGSAEDEALARLGDANARRLLAVLTDDQRDVLLLRVIGDLSLEETAAVLGRPVGAVKSLQHRALGRLRKKVAAPTSAAAVSRDTAAAITGLR